MSYVDLMPAGPDLDISRPQQYAAPVAGAALPNPRCQPDLDLSRPCLTQQYYSAAATAAATATAAEGLW